MVLEQRLFGVFKRALGDILGILRQAGNLWHLALAGYSAYILAATALSSSMLQVTFIPFVLFMPGYAIVLVGLSTISPSEKAVLSFGLSIAVFAAFNTAVRLAFPGQNATVITISSMAIVSLLIFGFKFASALRKL